MLSDLAADLAAAFANPLLPALSAVGGVLFGLAADRLAARWPEHEPGVPHRTVDWRTVVVAFAGGAMAFALVARWPETRDLLLLGIYAAALVVLLATDLDQKLLPDLLTLPLTPFAAVLLVAGWSPLLADKELALFSGIAAGIGAPLLLIVTDRLLKGELGEGDLKLAVSIGLLSGIGLFVVGLMLASIAISVVLIVLIVFRRIGLKSPIPFGPVLIFGAFLSMLIG